MPFVEHIGIYPVRFILHLPQKTNADNGNKWHTVGIFKDLTQTITGYIDHDEWNSSMLSGILTSENIPDLSAFKRIALEPGTPYRFRLAALNGCGLGEFGEVSIHRRLWSTLEIVKKSLKC